MHFGEPQTRGDIRLNEQIWSRRIYPQVTGADIGPNETGSEGERNKLVQSIERPASDLGQPRLSVTGRVSVGRGSRA